MGAIQSEIEFKQVLLEAEKSAQARLIEEIAELAAELERIWS